MDSKVRQYGPWVVLLGILGTIGYVVLPLLTHLIWDTINIVIGGALLGVIVYALPLCAMTLRNLLWKARKEVIEAMPIETLEIGLQKMGAGIEEFKGRIAQAKGEYANLTQEIRASKDVLSDDDIKEQQGQLEGFKTLIDNEVQELGRLQTVYAGVSRNVSAAKVKLRLGQGIKAAAGALTAGHEGAGAMDMDTAFSSINRQLNEAQAQLEMALSRPARPVRATVTEIKPEALPSSTTSTPAPTDYPLHDKRRA